MSILARFSIRYPGFALATDLELPGRGITALFGPSGSGKTTLLRAIAGLERWPGRLAINGDVWQDKGVFLPTHRRPLGYVFQEASLFPHLTVQGNIDYGALRCRSAANRVDRAAIIDLLGIGALLGRSPAHLSGGERQRVAIARALLTDPQLLLMDEPLAALDFARKNEILPYLEKLHDALDIPALYVSHSPEEVARLADHLVVLDASGVVAQGPLREVLGRIKLPIHLGEDVSVVFDARTVEHDAQWHLVRMTFPGGSLWVGDAGHPLGKQMRVRILARDVSITRERSAGSSIVNILPATVVEVAEDRDPAACLVRLQVGASPLVARVTRRSAAALNLTPGLDVWAQIKAVALIG